MTIISAAVVINERDNVAIALRGLAAGTEISVDMRGRVETITLRSDIPLGHKLALQDIEAGAPVIKYGEPIGESTTRIARGEHVHTHNVASRARGDGR
jgi:altronate dehydratase